MFRGSSAGYQEKCLGRCVPTTNPFLRAWPLGSKHGDFGISPKFRLTGRKFNLVIEEGYHDSDDSIQRVKSKETCILTMARKMLHRGS